MEECGRNDALRALIERLHALERSGAASVEAGVALRGALHHNADRLCDQLPAYLVSALISDQRDADALCSPSDNPACHTIVARAVSSTLLRKEGTWPLAWLHIYLSLAVTGPSRLWLDDSECADFAAELRASVVALSYKDRNSCAGRFMYAGAEPLIVAAVESALRRAATALREHDREGSDSLALRGRVRPIDAARALAERRTIDALQAGRRALDVLKDAARVREVWRLAAQHLPFLLESTSLRPHAAAALECVVVAALGDCDGAIPCDGSIYGVDNLVADLCNTPMRAGPAAIGFVGALVTLARSSPRHASHVIRYALQQLVACGEMPQHAPELTQALVTDYCKAPTSSITDASSVAGPPLRHALRATSAALLLRSLLCMLPSCASSPLNGSSTALPLVGSLATLQHFSASIEAGVASAAPGMRPVLVALQGIIAMCMAQGEGDLGAAAASCFVADCVGEAVASFVTRIPPLPDLSVSRAALDKAASKLRESEPLDPPKPWVDDVTDSAIAGARDVLEAPSVPSGYFAPHIDGDRKDHDGGETIGTASDDACLPVLTIADSEHAAEDADVTNHREIARPVTHTLELPPLTTNGRNIPTVDIGLGKFTSAVDGIGDAALLIGPGAPATHSHADDITSYGVHRVPPDVLFRLVLEALRSPVYTASAGTLLLQASASQAGVLTAEAPTRLHSAGGTERHPFSASSKRGWTANATRSGNHEHGRSTGRHVTSQSAVICQSFFQLLTAEPVNLHFPLISLIIFSRGCDVIGLCSSSRSTERVPQSGWYRTVQEDCRSNTKEFNDTSHAPLSVLSSVAPMATIEGVSDRVQPDDDIVMVTEAIKSSTEAVASCAASRVDDPGDRDPGVVSDVELRRRLRELEAFRLLLRLLRAMVALRQKDIAVSLSRATIFQQPAPTVNEREHGSRVNVTHDMKSLTTKTTASDPHLHADSHRFANGNITSKLLSPAAAATCHEAEERTFSRDDDPRTGQQDIITSLASSVAVDKARSAMRKPALPAALSHLPPRARSGPTVVPRLLDASTSLPIGPIDSSGLISAGTEGECSADVASSETLADADHGSADLFLPAEKRLRTGACGANNFPSCAPMVVRLPVRDVIKDADATAVDAGTVALKPQFTSFNGEATETAVAAELSLLADAATAATANVLSAFLSPLHSTRDTALLWLACRVIGISSSDIESDAYPRERFVDVEQPAKSSVEGTSSVVAEVLSTVLCCDATLTTLRPDNIPIAAAVLPSPLATDALTSVTVENNNAVCSTNGAKPNTSPDVTSSAPYLRPKRSLRQTRRPVYYNSDVSYSTNTSSSSGSESDGLRTTENCSDDDNDWIGVSQRRKGAHARQSLKPPRVQKVTTQNRRPQGVTSAVWRAWRTDVTAARARRALYAHMQSLPYIRFVRLRPEHSVNGGSAWSVLPAPAVTADDVKRLDESTIRRLALPFSHPMLPVPACGYALAPQVLAVLCCRPIVRALRALQLLDSEALRMCTTTTTSTMTPDITIERVLAVVDACGADNERRSWLQLEGTGREILQSYVTAQHIAATFVAFAKH